MPKINMGLRNTLFLTLQLSVCLTVTLSENSNVCSTPGWFGSNCQYKCRCNRESCHDDGVCADDVCKSGWFGPGCQYQDLGFSYAKTDALNWLYDGNNDTCNTDPQSQEINVNLTLAFVFTWLRLQVKDPSLIHEFQVTFSDASNQATNECKNKRSATVNERTVDVHCDLDVTTQFVILKGEGVKSLCSLYISGGRNVALHQRTSQSSIYTNSGVDGPDKSNDTNAVDGSTNGTFDNKSCTHTKPEDKNPTWNVTLSREQLINRYVLYNRIDNNNGYRLKGFTLTSFTKQQQVVYNYTDMDTEVRNVYTLINLPENVSVSLVTIKAVKNQVDLILTLCEVELYGDSMCPPKKYGRECNNTCNCANNEELCFVSTGGCPSGCPPGFQGESCYQSCASEKYGPGCNFACSQSCNKTNIFGSSCHNVDGMCLQGCQSGYQPPRCDKLIQDDDITVVVGLTLTLFVLVIFLITGVFFRRKYTTLTTNKSNLYDKRKNDYVNCKNDDPVPNEEVMFTEQETNFSDNGGRFKPAAQNHPDAEIYSNTFSGGSPTSIAVDYLSCFMDSRDKNFFQQQFNTIPENTNASITAGMKEGNKVKNRYKNICAYDHSRVQLQINKNKNQGDYINASYVEGYKRQQTFIASQGPTRAVLEDFVRMLSEQGVEVVVVLTNLTENGKIKTEKYWPEDGEMEAGDIKVRLTTTQVFADYTIRRLQLLQEGQPVQNLTQFHFTSWPDKDVPTTAWSLVDFEQRIASISTDKPIVVHCSAGVGRTGTFIALHNALRQATDTGNIDFVTTVQKLRQDRINMVQTVGQYIFLHRAAQVAIVCMGTTIKSSNITEKFQILKKISKQSNLQNEYQAVCSLCDETNIESKDKNIGEYRNIYENSQIINNNLKNRFQNILAKEDYRVILTGNSDEGFGNFINAVFLPSFSRKNQNILTQLPLPTTVIDFWRMITQNNVTLVVAFQEDLVQADSSIGNYFPSLGNKELNVSYFKVRSEEISSGRLFSKQKLVITTDSANNQAMPGSSISGKDHHLQHLTFTGDLTDLKPEDLLALMTEVRSCSPAGDGRTVYMCRNGAEYSGLACVLSLLLNRLDNDHHLTVPLVVGSIKAIRPQVIPTVHQYKLLYHVLKLYNDSNSIYSNF